MLITFEGLPGAGKSTQARMLAHCLRAGGHPVTTLPDLATLTTTPVAATLIDLLHTSGDPFLRTGDAITDTLMTAAIRADLVATVLDPALTSSHGAIVIEDRGLHTMASYAIAGLLRQHRAPIDTALTWLDSLNTLTGPCPARALWLRVPPDLAARRADDRGTGDSPPFNGEQRAHLTWVDRAYALLAEQDPQLTAVDVDTLDPISTHHTVLHHINQTTELTLKPCPGHHDTVETAT